MEYAAMGKVHGPELSNNPKHNIQRMSSTAIFPTKPNLSDLLPEYELTNRASRQYANIAMLQG